MTKRGLSIVLVVALLALCAAGLALWQNDRPRQITTNELLFPDLAAKAKDIARIEIAADGQTVVIERQDKGWTLPTKDYYPADATRMGQLIATLAHIAPIEEKTSDPTRYGELGLAPPTAKEPGSGKEIKLLDAHGGTIALAVIGRSAINLGRVGGGFYVRRPDQPACWLTEGTIDVPENAIPWTRHSVFDLTDPRAIKTAIVTAGGKTVANVSRNKPDEESFFITPAPPGKQDDGEALRLITLPVSLPFDDVRAASPDDGAPMRTGIFRPFAAEGPTYQIDVLGPGKDGWVKVSEIGETKDVKPFNALHSQWVYKLPPYRAELLLANIKDYALKAKAGKEK